MGRVRGSLFYYFIQLNAEFRLCVNQTKLCIINRHRHTLTCRLRGVTVTQDPSGPSISVPVEKGCCPECSRNKLMFCRDLDRLPPATEMDYPATVPCALGCQGFKKALVRYWDFRADLPQEDNRAVWTILSTSRLVNLQTPVRGQNRHTDHVLIFNQNVNCHCYSE